MVESSESVNEEAKDSEGNVFQKVKANVKGRFGGIASRIRTTDFVLVREGISKPILEPSFIPQKFLHEVPRTAQWMAAFLLPILIIVTLAIDVAILETIEGVLLNGEDLGEQSNIFQFFTTAMGLGIFILSAWGWFLWVRTGGFKLFDH